MVICVSHHTLSNQLFSLITQQYGEIPKRLLIESNSCIAKTVAYTASFVLIFSQTESSSWYCQDAYVKIYVTVYFWLAHNTRWIASSVEGKILHPQSMKSESWKSTVQELCRLLQCILYHFAQIILLIDHFPLTLFLPWGILINFTAYEYIINFIGLTLICIVYHFKKYEYILKWHFSGSVFEKVIIQRLYN